MAARINPSQGGKPDKLMRTALLLELKQTAEDDAGNKSTKLRLVARKLIARALDQGDVTAIKEINDRVDGRAPQAITGESGGALVVEIIKKAAP